MATAVLLLALALAGSPAADLSRARALVSEQLRYEDGITVLERLAADSRLSTAQRIETYRLLGVAYVATNAPEAAEMAFVEVLRLDPDHALDPMLSPKIQGVFDRAKRRAVRPARFTEVRAIPEARRVRVTARLEDPQGRVSQVRLFARTGPGHHDPASAAAWPSEFEAQQTAREGDEIEGAVLLPQLGTIRLDYYLAGLGADGAVVARAGSADAPSSLVVERALAVAPPPALATRAPAPWYGRWWVWTAVGAVVVGAAVTSAVVLSSREGEPPMGTLPPISID